MVRYKLYRRTNLWINLLFRLNSFYFCCFSLFFLQPENTTMKTRLLLSSFILTLVLNACAQKANPANPVAKMGWLVGTWQGTYKGQPFYEAWKKKNDSTLVNFTIEVTQRDTIIKEHGAIVATSKGTLHRGVDAQWKLIDVNDTLIVLGNDTLKFANRITWSHSKNDHWLVVIQNPKNVVEYDLVRVDWLDKYVDRFIARVTGEKR
jgi:hypothetical protein